MQHSRNKHTTNHDENSLNFFTTPLEFTTDPKDPFRHIATIALYQLCREDRPLILER